MRDLSKKSIREFLANFGDEVYDMPDSHLDLIMDDHKCVKWHGIEYFISECNMFGNDESIFDHLIDKYSL